MLNLTLKESFMQRANIHFVSPIDEDSIDFFSCIKIFEDDPEFKLIESTDIYGNLCVIKSLCINYMPDLYAWSHDRLEGEDLKGKTIQPPVSVIRLTSDKYKKDNYPYCLIGFDRGSFRLEPPYDDSKVTMMISERLVEQDKANKINWVDVPSCPDLSGCPIAYKITNPLFYSVNFEGDKPAGILGRCSNDRYLFTHYRLPENIAKLFFLGEPVYFTQKLIKKFEPEELYTRRIKTGADGRKYKWCWE